MRKIYFITALFLLSLLSCEDILNKQPLDIISDAVLWSDPILIDDYLNQCYAEMNFYFEMPYEHDVNFLMANRSHDAITLSDEAMCGWADEIEAPQTKDITISGGVFEWWGYPTLRRLNIFIEKMDALELDESYKNNRIAEARFLRAFSFFNLVKRYGGIPLITKAQKLDDPKEELYPKRDKEEVVYQFIISEIDAIYNNLPESFGDGRATKYAALALKSRAALYAASIAEWGEINLDGVVGIPSEMAEYFWEIAYNASKEIMSSGKFTLYNKSEDKVQNYRNIFLDKDNPEVIFSERFDGISGKGHIWDMLEVPYSYHVWGKGQNACVYLEMVESYDNIDGTSGTIDRELVDNEHLWTVEELFGKKDPRFKASIYTHGTPWTHTEGPFILDYHDAIETTDGVLTSGSYKGVLSRSQSYGRPTPFGILKYLDESLAVEHERGYSKTDYIVFRYAEILLNFAEAAFELGRTQEAKDAINLIRSRAGMFSYESIDRKKIRKERKIELAFEGNRYFDLRRWRTATEKLTHSFHGIRYILDGTSIVEGGYDVMTQRFKLEIIENVTGLPHPFFDEQHYYLPISLSRTTNNPNLVENPGYK